MNRLSLTGYAVIAVLLVAGGLYAGWWLYGPQPAKPESYAPSVSQQDGSLVLERKPDVKAKPKQMIPAGGKVERVVEVVVKPTTPVPVNPDGPSAPCPPVRVDMSLVRMPDDSRRVVASSPDGEVVGGVDTPVESARPEAEPPKWAAGLSVNPLSRTYGVFLDRDFGPFRVGAEINKLSGAADIDARVKAGIRF